MEAAEAEIAAMAARNAALCAGYDSQVASVAAFYDSCEGVQRLHKLEAELACAKYNSDDAVETDISSLATLRDLLPSVQRSAAAVAAQTAAVLGALSDDFRARAAAHCQSPLTEEQLQAALEQAAALSR